MSHTNDDEHVLWVVVVYCFSMQEERMLRQLEAANTAAYLRYSVEIEQLRDALHARAKLRSLYWVCLLVQSSFFKSLQFLLKRRARLERKIFFHDITWMVVGCAHAGCAVETSPDHSATTHRSPEIRCCSGRSSATGKFFH